VAFFEVTGPARFAPPRSWTGSPPGRQRLRNHKRHTSPDAVARRPPGPWRRGRHPPGAGPSPGTPQRTATMARRCCHQAGASSIHGPQMRLTRPRPCSGTPPNLSAHSRCSLTPRQPWRNQNNQPGTRGHDQRQLTQKETHPSTNDAARTATGGHGCCCDTRSHVVSELVEEVWLMPET
jgi:hypothetical protein